MRLPTTIPDSQHLDLEQPGTLTVDARLDAAIQIAMIRAHAWLMGVRLGRAVSELEAARDWIATGMAEAYRRHYKRIRLACDTLSDG